MTEEEFTELLFTTDINMITELSIVALLIVFMCRLIVKDLGFEHLKMMTTIIVFAFTLEFSILLYKAEQKISLTNYIINIKTSTLSYDDKEKYIKDFSSEKKSLDNLETSNIIFSMTKIILLLILILTIVDTLNILNNKYKLIDKFLCKSKDNKA